VCGRIYLTLIVWVLTLTGALVGSRGQIYRGVRLSSAAQTHNLHKLHTPSRCFECDRHVYFQGAECEQVSVCQTLLLFNTFYALNSQACWCLKKRNIMNDEVSWHISYWWSSETSRCMYFPVQFLQWTKDSEFFYLLARFTGDPLRYCMSLNCIQNSRIQFKETVEDVVTLSHS